MRGCWCFAEFVAAAAAAAARRPAPLYGLGSGNAELVSREISAIREEYRAQLSYSNRGGGRGVEGVDVGMNGWFTLLMMQRDGERRERVGYGWMMTRGMYRWMNIRVNKGG